jgi:Flp pilus assembly protein TadG
MRARNLLLRLSRCENGTALIETALVAPTLIMLAIGGFEASAMVARQSELQSSAEQASEIALAVVPDTQAERDQIKAQIMESTGLGDARVKVDPMYRCGTGELVSGSTAPACSEDSLNTFISIDLTAEYQPVWTSWGFGRSFEYHVNRMVQIS